MRVAVLLGCLALALADSATPAKRGIGPEAFAPAKSQDTTSTFNLQSLVANQQAQSLPQGYGIQADFSRYQSPYFDDHGLNLFASAPSQSGYRIPPQSAPQQKPAQLALAAAAAVAQQNFGHPAFGQPPQQNQDPQAAIINNQLYGQPQYQEYQQQLQAYVRQPVALNYGNTRINAYPLPPPQPVPQVPPQPQTQSQVQIPSTFQAAYEQGLPYGGFGYNIDFAKQFGSQSIFRPAPPQVRPEVAQPAAVSYAPSSQPVPVQYAAPQPVPLQYNAPQQSSIKYSAPINSYGSGYGSGNSGAFSYSSFSSGGKEINSGFRPINPLYS